MTESLAVLQISTTDPQWHILAPTGKTYYKLPVIQPAEAPMSTRITLLNHMYHRRYPVFHTQIVPTGSDAPNTYTLRVDPFPVNWLTFRTSAEYQSYTFQYAVAKPNKKAATTEPPTKKAKKTVQSKDNEDRGVYVFQLSLMYRKDPVSTQPVLDVIRIQLEGIAPEELLTLTSALWLATGPRSHPLKGHAILNHSIEDTLRQWRFQVGGDSVQFSDEWLQAFATERQCVRDHLAYMKRECWM